MRRVVLVARVLTGLALFASGITGLLGLAPQQELAGPAGDFMRGLVASGYLMPLVKVVETATGALLLANRWVPLALVLVVPVMLNAMLFHAFLAPEGVAPSAVILALTVFLMWAYRGHYAPLKRAKAEPTAAAVTA